MKNKISELSIKTIWEFIRGDMPIEQFEHWFYQCKELEALLPSDFYLELISTNFKRISKHNLLKIKINLKNWINETHPLPCRCLTWKNICILWPSTDEEEEFIDYLETLPSIKKQTPWLEAVLCPTCHTVWYIGLDTVIDNYHIKRLSPAEVEDMDRDIWPTDFANNPYLY